MKIGFTGTRDGMTARQISMLRDMFILGRLKSKIEEFHHGLCVGSDEQAAELVSTQFPDVRIVCHPPINRTFESRIVKPDWVVLPRMDYMERNHSIVDSCDILVAAPDSYIEKLRSGTWSTVRYANRVGRKTYIFYPFDPRMR